MEDRKAGGGVLVLAPVGNLNSKNRILHLACFCEPGIQTEDSSLPTQSAIINLCYQQIGDPHRDLGTADDQKVPNRHKIQRVDH